MLFSIYLFGQSDSKKDTKYKPKDFNESLIQLDKLLPDSTKGQIKIMTEEEFMCKSHFSTGTWIRNYWLYNRYLFGLIVTQSDLRKDLQSKKLFNNDDMSSLILRSFYRKLQNKDLQVDQQIKEIHQFYINMNNPEWRKQQDSISWINIMKKYTIGDTLTNHVYYDRNWLGEPKHNTVITAIISDKANRQVKINILSFGKEANKDLILKEIDCVSGDCWVNPNWWRKSNEKE